MAHRAREFATWSDIRAHAFFARSAPERLLASHAARCAFIVRKLGFKNAHEYGPPSSRKRAIKRLHATRMYDTAFPPCTKTSIFPIADALALPDQMDVVAALCGDVFRSCLSAFPDDTGRIETWFARYFMLQVWHHTIHLMLRANDRTTVRHMIETGALAHVFSDHPDFCADRLLGHILHHEEQLYPLTFGNTSLLACAARRQLLADVVDALGININGEEALHAACFYTNIFTFEFVIYSLCRQHELGVDGMRWIYATMGRSMDADFAYLRIPLPPGREVQHVETVAAFLADLDPCPNYTSCENSAA